MKGYRPPKIAKPLSPPLPLPPPPTAPVNLSTEQSSSGKKVMYTIGFFVAIAIGYILYRYFKKENEKRVYENSPAVKSVKQAVQKATSICKKCPSDDPVCTPEVNTWIKDNCKNGTYVQSLTGPLDMPLCIATEWSPWSSCSATCGGGVQKRTRVVMSDGVTGCGYEEIRQCNTGVCAPEDCIMSEWKEGECSVKCGTGIKKLTRSVLTPAKYGGACGSTGMETSCTQEPCCTFLGWGEWSDCSEPCGPGIQIRRMNMTGMLCPSSDDPAFIETRECNKEECCTDLEWSDWSTCSATCGPGTQTRRLSTTGMKCPPPDDSRLNEARDCTNGECCSTGPWSDWSECTDICGGGTQFRTRTTRGLCGPEVVTRETRSCNTEPCCTYDEWSEWGPCSAECSGGFHTRTRNATGPRCPGPESIERKETRMCNSGACCTPLGWGEWSQCTTGCKEIQTRVMNVTGPRCPPPTDPSRIDSRPCVTGPCCDVGEWTEWTTCSKPCEGGYRGRTRSATGFCVDVVTQEAELCNTGPCCVYDANWSEWSSCSGATCGTGGTQFRTRGATGPLCPPPTDATRYETRACNTGPCCIIGTWSRYGSCSKACGGGVQTRTRTISSGCPAGTATSETISCNTQSCCTWGDWSAWTPCSATCGVGTTQRTRAATGLLCPPLSDPSRVEYATCNTGVTCPPVCSWTYMNGKRITGGTVSNSNAGTTLGAMTDACCNDPNCKYFSRKTNTVSGPIQVTDPAYNKSYRSDATIVNDADFTTYMKN